MRKDSRIFLTKLLEYREKVNKDSFELNYQYFIGIPNIEANIYDIMRDLINNDCISSNSQVMNLEGDIKIFLTSDGITYFDEMEKKKGELQSTVWNVYGGQISIANDNGNIESIQNNNIAAHQDYSIEKASFQNLQSTQRENAVDDCENKNIFQINCLEDEHKESEMDLNKSIANKVVNNDIIQSNFTGDNCIKENVKKDSMKTNNEQMEVVQSVQIVDSQNYSRKKRAKSYFMQSLLTFAIIMSILFFIIIKNEYYFVANDIVVSPYSTYISVCDIEVTDIVIKRINKLKKVTSITFERCKFEDGVLSKLKNDIEEFCMIDCTNVSNYDFLMDMIDLHSVIIQNCGITDDNFPLLKQNEIYSICISKNDMFTDLSILPLENLYKLDFSDTSVDDIASLSNSTELYEINGSNTLVSDISSLANLEKLKTMYFDFCDIQEIRAEFLSLRMKNISFEGNRITDCSGFCNFTILENVNLRDNKLSEISWLEKNTATLKVVDLSNNQLEKNQISFLANCTTMEEIYLNGIEMDSLSIVSGMKELKSLEAVNCGIQEIADLKGLLKLQWVRLAQNEINDISVLKELGSSTVKFDLAYNNITSISYLPKESELLILFENPISISNNKFDQISGSTIILDYTQGMLDCTLNFENIYIINCPMDQRVKLEAALRTPHFVTNAETLQLLETEKIYYD